jgi:ankyrin repeat protein
LIIAYNKKLIIITIYFRESMRYLLILVSIFTFSMAWPVFDKNENIKSQKSDKIIDTTKTKTRLHIAIESGESIFKIIDLVKSGAEMKGVDKYGDTILHYAARRGDLSIIEYLVQNGSDIKAKNFIGLTPIDIAIESAQLEAFDLMKKLLTDQRWLDE